MQPDALVAAERRMGKLCSTCGCNILAAAQASLLMAAAAARGSLLRQLGTSTLRQKRAINSKRGLHQHTTWRCVLTSGR